MSTRLITTSLSTVIVCIILFIAVLNTACEKGGEIGPVSKLIDGFRAEGLPVVETRFDSLANTYTLLVPADADLAKLTLVPMVAAGVSLSPAPSEISDYSNPVSFELRKKKSTSQTIFVKVNKLPVGSNAPCLVTRIESMDHPDEYFTFEYNAGGLVSRIRTSLLFSNWGIIEFYYANAGIGRCLYKGHHLGYSDDYIECSYDDRGKLTKVMLTDWTDRVDWLGLGNMSVNQYNEYTGQPGRSEFIIDNRGLMSELRSFNSDAKKWESLKFEYDGKKHFMAGSRTGGILNWFLHQIGSRNSSQKDLTRIDLVLEFITLRQNISALILQDGAKVDYKYTYNNAGFPITNETTRLRFFYSNCN